MMRPLTTPDLMTMVKDSAEVAGDDKIVSNYLRGVFELYVGYWIVFFVSVLGLVTNSLTIIVFLRQGFRDTVNVSLFAIAVWDHAKCIAAFVRRLHIIIGFINPVWGINWKMASFNFSIYLPIFAGYVSYALATHVSVERCLSVTLPFKVKSLFTPAITASLMVGISLVVFGSFSPMFFVYTVEYNFDPLYNASVGRMAVTDLMYAHDGIVLKMYSFLGIFYTAIFSTIMVITSIIIVLQLRKSAENLEKMQAEKSTGSSRPSAKMTSKEAKVTKMLLVIIFVYLMDFLPRVGLYTAGLVEPEFFAFRKYHNLVSSLMCFLWVLDFTNASVNFFILMGMSSNFNRSFYEVFPQVVKRTNTCNPGTEKD